LPIFSLANEIICYIFCGIVARRVAFYELSGSFNAITILIVLFNQFPLLLKNIHVSTSFYSVLKEVLKFS